MRYVHLAVSFCREFCKVKDCVVNNFLHCTALITDTFSFFIQQTHDVILKDDASITGASVTAGGDDNAAHSLYRIHKDDLVIVVHPHPSTARPDTDPSHPTATTATASATATKGAATDSPDTYYTAGSPSSPTTPTSSNAHATHSTHSHPSHPSHHSLHSLHTNINSNASNTSNTSTTRTSPTTPATTAHTDLGIFSELILSILTHELTTGYLWEVPVGANSGTNSVCGGAVGVGGASDGHGQHSTVLRARAGARMHNNISNTAHFNTSTTHPHTNSDHNLLSSLLSRITPYFTSTTTNNTTITTTSTPGFCTSVPDHGVPVRKFRSSPDNFAFLIGAEGSVQCGGGGGDIGGGAGSGGVGGVGGGSGGDDDTRYYSDGL